MKTTLKFLFLSLALAALAGCATQKRAGKAELAAVLHAQALKALETESFKIEITEYYEVEPYIATKTRKKPVRDVSGSSVSMQDGEAVIRFSWNLFPRATLDRLNIRDDAAKLIREENAKNGDEQFRLEVRGGKSWLNRTLHITLYKNTNECLVRDGNGVNGASSSFRGIVTPLEE